MRNPVVGGPIWISIVLALGVICSAQSAAPSNSSLHANEFNLEDMPPTDSFPQSSLLNIPDHKAVNGQTPGSQTPSQLPGHVSGTVFDETGAVMVGARVRLTAGSQPSEQEVRSGNNGQFNFANIAPGLFRVEIASSGFGTREFSGSLRPGETYLIPSILLVVAKAVTDVHVVDAPLTAVELVDFQIKEQEKQRVLGLFPNFYVTYTPDALPLTSSQKFRLAWKTSVDPMTFVGVGMLAGVEQATNAFDEYGQGGQGYAKRFGSSYADVVAGTFIGSAILPSLLKQDPRYFYKGTGNTGSRLLYAVASPIFCRGDNMRWQPNYSNVAGAFLTGGLSTLYYPASGHTGAGLVVGNSLIRLGEMAVEGVLQEFVIRRLTPRRASNKR
jgi:hypothetical protein